MEITGKIICKKSDNKAFKLGEDWYNVNAPVIPYLEKVNKGDLVTVQYEKKGVSRYVSKLMAGQTAPTPKAEPVETATEFACEDCGTKLKDGKYKKCYPCGKKAYKGGSVKSGTSQSYDNPERTAQIQRGNALNAAGAVASSQQFADPETAKQFTLMLADEFLAWLRAE